MIKKVDTIDMLPDDIKELLLPDVGEFFAVGSDAYEIKQFPVGKYFDLLKFISKYYTTYNGVFEEDANRSATEFFGSMAAQLKDNGLVTEFMSEMFPEIPNGGEVITYPQLAYLLGVVYKLNFLSRLQIQDMETRNAYHQMQQMLGLNLTPQTS